MALFFDDNGLKNLAENMELTLSPQGFWSGRGAVSYTQSGGFVSFLIEKYGINKFGKVYAKGDFLNVYDKPLQSLLAEWVLHLKLLRKNIQQKKWAKFAADFTQKRFSVPSLFEQKCPHCVLVNQKKAEQAWHLMQPYQPKINPNEMIRLLQDNPEGTAVWVEFCIKQKDFDKAALLLQKLPLGNLKSSLEARLLYQKGMKQKAMVALKKVAQEIPYFARRTKVEIRRMLYLLENDLPIEVLPQTSFLRFEQAIEKYQKTEAQNIAQEALKNAEDELMRRFWQQKREMLVQF